MSCILDHILVYTRITPELGSINQDVGQDVLSEFQRSPFSKKCMATNVLNPASFCVTGYNRGHSYHLRAEDPRVIHLGYIL